MNEPLIDPAALRSELTPEAAAALDEMLETLATDPARISRLFPAAARRTARGDIGLSDSDGRPVLAEDAVRVVVFAAAMSALPTQRRAEEARALYRHGDADEKRAVVLGLSTTEADGVDILEDALRTNDTRLVAAAMGRCAAALDDDSWRQGVLKCLFVGVALSAVSDLDRRCDAELGDMVARYAHERVAAGRDVPADVWRVLELHPASLDRASLEAELASEHPDRAAAARRMLASRPTTQEEI